MLFQILAIVRFIDATIIQIPSTMDYPIKQADFLNKKNIHINTNHIQDCKDYKNWNLNQTQILKF